MVILLELAEVIFWLTVEKKVAEGEFQMIVVFILGEKFDAEVVVLGKDLAASTDCQGVIQKLVGNGPSIAVAVSVLSRYFFSVVGEQENLDVQVYAGKKVPVPANDGFIVCPPFNSRNF
jgi:hypothetical protein